MSATHHTFGDRYEVIERVGSGGMAEVYRARDGLLGREVAVKVLSERLAHDRAFVDRFRREAQSAANLNHPNIVSLYDFGEDGNTYYIVMELIEGRSLGDIVRDEGSLLPERAAEIATDVAKALTRAHAAGLVHRDIKPSNIMITSSGQTKVTDFGIARALSPDGDATVTQTGMVIGTASYLSPEQAQGDPVDQRSDIYSLGCCLFEMLTGRAPFTGDTPLAIAYKHVREDPDAPSAVNADVPTALDAIVLKAMAKNPDNRYHTAEEMAADLGRFRGGQKVLATPILEDRTAVASAATGTQMMERDYEEEERSRAGWYVALAVLILLLFGALAWLLADNLLGGDIEVPDVVGMTEAEAREELTRAGLENEVVEQPSAKAPAGEVFKQDPEAGEMVDEGDVVTIYVSTGTKQTVVPDLEDLTQEEAEEKLEEAKLEVGEIIEEPSAEIDEGRVIRSDPPAGDKVDVRSPVDLIVSTGAEVVIVPFVVGQTEEDATAEIEAVGLEVNVIRQPGEEEEGRVIAQDPAGGAEAEAGDTVTITVSEGPEEFPLPDVSGREGDDAEAELEDLGLVVDQVEEACSEPQPPGRVCRSEPPAGTMVKEGDQVTLIVQAGGASVGDGFPLALLGFLTFWA